jgi:DNA-binding beta-propeller fold protein YncE
VSSRDGGCQGQLGFGANVAGIAFLLAFVSGLATWARWPGAPDCGGPPSASGRATGRTDGGGSAASVDSATTHVAFHTIADIPLPGEASRFDYQSLDERNDRLYLAHMGGGSVIAVDTRRRTVVAEIGGLPRVTGVWAVPELSRLYASPTGLHQVAIIDTRTLSVVSKVGHIGFPDGIAYAPAAKKVFVSDEAGGGELVIDAAHDRATGTIPLGGEAGNTIYEPGSGCILVAVQTRNQVVAINPRTERIVGRYTLEGAARPHGLAVDPLRRLLFVANEESATLLVVDLRSMRVTGRHAVGNDPDVLAYDPGRRWLFVAAESGSLTVLGERGDGLARLGVLPLADAHSVSVSKNTHLVYLPLANVAGRPVLRILQVTDVP